jgi:hypothetical protein
MKSTLMSRQMTANPRRTTLAHLKDLPGTGLTAAPAEQAEDAPAPRVLPSSTANPKRTVLTELPKGPAV